MNSSTQPNGNDRSHEGEEEKVSSIALRITTTDATRLKVAALNAGLPAAVLTRAFLLDGLAKLEAGHKPTEKLVKDAAAAEHDRRVKASAIGGQRKAANLKKKE